MAPITFEHITKRFVESTAVDDLSHLRLKDAAVIAMLPAEPRLKMGAQETFSVPLQKVLLFDEESTHAVGTAG